jgi:hypothetical protein
MRRNYEAGFGVRGREYWNDLSFSKRDFEADILHNL